MALTDITLGQYFPGNSPIHRLDPRAKLVALILYIVALFLCKWFISYALIFAVLILVTAVSTVKPKALLRGLKPILILLIFTAVLNMLYTPGRKLVSFWIFTITYEGILHAFFMVIRIMLLISCTFLLTYTTSPLALTDGLEGLLSPLMMSIALRFIPTLIEETDKIMSAQRARGADFDTGNLLQKAKALIPLLVPLFISAFRRADELATAMECRCYHGGAGRTRMNRLHFRGADALFMTAALIITVAAGILGHFGL